MKVKQLQVFKTMAIRDKRSLIFALVLGMALASCCVAGMPSVLPEHWSEATSQLTEVTTERLQAISFFAVILFVCTLAIQWLWNIIAKNSVWLPKLSIGKAFVLILLWGTLFVIVLTMISGARELLTPGAWKQEGMIKSVFHLGQCRTMVACPSMVFARVGRRLRTNHSALEVRINRAPIC